MSYISRKILYLSIVSPLYNADTKQDIRPTQGSLSEDIFSLLVKALSGEFRKRASVQTKHH